MHDANIIIYNQQDKQTYFIFSYVFQLAKLSLWQLEQLNWNTRQKNKGTNT